VEKEKNAVRGIIYGITNFLVQSFCIILRGGVGAGVREA
jgi:hypothetical protein